MDNKTMQTVNPLTEQVIKTYNFMSDDAAVGVVEKSHAAFLDWRLETLDQRAKVIAAIAAELRKSKDDFAQLMTDEVGKRLKDSRDEIELCASIKGIVRLKVIAILPHAIILQRTEGDRECNIENVEIFYLLTPDSKPVTPARCLPAGLPLLFHFAGRFWHCDPQSKQETLLDSSSALSYLSGSRYSNDAYDDVNVRGFGLWRLAASTTPVAKTQALLGKRP